MGLIPIDLCDQAYTHIRTRAHQPTQQGSAGPVVICVAPDIDAICALKILVAMLKSDCVPYHIMPVSTHDALTQSIESMLGHSSSETAPTTTIQPSSVVLINAGGMVNLTDLFTSTSQPADDASTSQEETSADKTDHVNVYVIDTHRPLNLHTMFGSPRIHVITDDGDIVRKFGVGEIREAFEDVEFGVELSDKEESDSGEDEDDSDADSDKDNESDKSDNDSNKDDDSEQSQEDDGSPKRKKKSKKSDISDSSDSSDNDDSDNLDKSDSDNSDKEDNQDEDLPKKKRRFKGSTDDVIKRRREKARRRRQLQTSRQLISEYYSSGTHYSSVPSSMIVYRMSMLMNKGWMDSVWWGIVGMTSMYVNDQIGMIKYVEGVEMYRDEVTRMLARVSSHERQPDLDEDAEDELDEMVEKQEKKGEIWFEQDLRLLMYRHWNLMDSMQNTPYVVGKVGLWKEKGKQKLKSMMIKMGISGKEYLQKHSEMSISVKRGLKGKIGQVGPMYALDEMFYPTFVRRVGGREVSASDVVYSIQALLNATDRPDDVVQDVGEIVDGEIGGMVGVGSGTILETNDGGTDCGFYGAVDGLSNNQVLDNGLVRAKKQQTSVVRTVLEILEKNKLVKLDGMRMAVVSHDCLRDIRRMLAMIVGGNVVVVGDCDDVKVCGETLDLERAAEMSGAEMRWDGWGLDVAAVEREDLGGFLECLQVVMKRNKH